MTHTTNIHGSCGIRVHDRSRRAAVDLRLRPRGHWDRHIGTLLFFIYALMLATGRSLIRRVILERSRKSEKRDGIIALAGSALHVDTP
jgi:hypothetical protein